MSQSHTDGAAFILKPHLHDTTCCQNGCQTGLTTGCIVYTNIQPVVKSVSQPVWQPAVSCVQPVVKLGCTTRFDNRLNEQWLFDQHGCQPGLTTGCIVKTGYNFMTTTANCLWLYTVNHKKRGSLFLTITLANLNRFMFFIILIVNKVIVKNKLPRFYGSLCILMTLVYA